MKKIILSQVTFLILFTTLLNSSLEAQRTEQNLPLIIAHRGASGHRPEHTREAYTLALDQGADYLEPDLVSTKDKVLIIRHENELSETTNVAQVFPNKKTTKIIDGEKKTGWFSEDLTLAEIKKLKARERLKFRNQSYNDQFEILTFSEFLEFIKIESKKRKKMIGIYPETKHPTYFQEINLALEEPLVLELKKHDLHQKSSPVFIQSFEITNLRKLKKLTDNQLVLLLDKPNSKPFDLVKAKKNLTYADLLKPDSLKELSEAISGLGPHKNFIIPYSVEGALLPETDFVSRAHALKLKVHPWTFRAEKEFLSVHFKNDLNLELKAFFKAGVDGVFTDFPDLAFKARLEFFNQKTQVTK